MKDIVTNFGLFSESLRRLLDYGAVFISLASLVLTGFALYVGYK